MRRLFNLLLAGASITIGVWINVTPSHATVEYGKKEKMACTTCHPPAKMKELTDAGKYYKDNGHSMKGYVAPKGDTKK